MADSPRPPFWLAVLNRTMPLLVVLVLWLVSAWLTLAWLRVDNTPPSWDPSVHLSHALYYYAYLTRLPFADAWAGLSLTSLYYPPLVHTAGALCYLAFGVIEPTIAGITSADVPVLANLFFMGLLLFSTYSLANRCYGVAAGLLAALLVACYPILVGQSHLFLLDYPLTALTVLAMALLAATDDLTHPVWVWPLGVAAGAALWTKWSFLFLFLPPLILAIVRGAGRVRDGAEPRLTWVRFGFNLAVVLSGLLLLAGPWYLSHPGGTVQELLTSNQTWRIDDDPRVFSFGGVLYYLQALFAQQIFAPFALLAAGGAAIAWLERDRLGGWPLLAAWVVGGGLVFWLVPNKDPRFTMPLLPALAVLSTSWLAPPPPGRRPEPRWSRIRTALVAVIVLFALAEQQAVALGLDFLPHRLGPVWAPVWSQEAQLATQPLRRDWPHRAIARDIALHTPPGGKVGVLPNTAHLNFLTLRYVVLWYHLPYLPDSGRVPKVEQLTHFEAGRETPATVATLLADGYDTLVLMTGDQGAHTQLIEQTVRNLAAERDELLAAYQRVGEQIMPGGEVVEVYGRRAEGAAWRR